MVLVVLFLVFNVQLYMANRDAAMQDTIGQSQQLGADINAEELILSDVTVTTNGNQATVSCQIKNTSPIAIELVNLWVQGASPSEYGNAFISIALSPGETHSLTKTVTLNETPSGSCSFWFVTARGNVISATSAGQGPPGPAGPAGDQGPAGPRGEDGTSGLVSSIKMDWLKFGFYDFGTTAPTDQTPLPAKQLGCDLPQDHYVMIGAEFTNMDPEGRTITLTPETYVWAINPRENTGGGALKTLLDWPIVPVQDGKIRTSFTSQDLYVNVPTMVYFFDWEDQTPHSTESPIPLSINLYGTTATGSYGQNIPFVSIKFTETMYEVTMVVTPQEAGVTTPSGSHRHYKDTQFSISASGNSNYKFAKWTSDTSGLTISNPSQASTSATAGASGTLTANFIPSKHFIDSANKLHDTTNEGTHSDFAAMQAGPDANYDTLTEGASANLETPATIGIWQGQPWIPGQDPGHQATNTIDGNTATYWSYNQDTEHYICFDLGQNYTITKIRLYQDLNTPNRRFGYGPEGNIDVYIWPYDNIDIFTKGYVTTWTDAADSGGWVDLTLPQTRVGRYIKLWEHDAADESSQRMYEFEFQYILHEAKLEAQFTNVEYYQLYTQLEIKTGNFDTAGETLSVYYWNNGAWTTLGNLNANAINTFAVTLTSPNFDIKFKSSDSSPQDSHQSTWQIDYCALIAP